MTECSHIWDLLGDKNATQILAVKRAYFFSYCCRNCKSIINTNDAIPCIHAWTYGACTYGPNYTLKTCTHCHETKVELNVNMTFGLGLPK